MRNSMLITVLFFTLAIHTSTSLGSDSVIAMCQDLNRADDTCVCAAEALRNEVGEDAYARYERVGTAYRANQQAGQDRSDAWMAALSSTGVTLDQTNQIGAAHRAKMSGCGG